MKPGGRCWMKTASDETAPVLSSMRWALSITNVECGRSIASRSSSKPATASSTDRGRCRSVRACGSSSLINASRAASTPVQKWAASWSLSSSDSHAVGDVDSAAQVATSDVFPVPAGATTRVSGMDVQRSR
jgi:hypothetical protein